MSAVTEWLAQPHSRTWLELVQAGEVPEFMYVGQAAAGPFKREARAIATSLGAQWAPWPSIDEWADAATCPTCHAGPGSPCVIKRRNSNITGQRWHIARERLNRHNHDVGAAPWPENRIPGRSYSSIDRKALV